MIASKSITITDKSINTHHGNPSTATYGRNMDIDSHQSHSLRRYGGEDQDAMDISVDDGLDDAHKIKHRDLQSNEPAPVLQDAQAVLDRPRDEEGRASMVDRQAYIPPKPDFSKDLLSLYNLHAIVASVARTDPVTGEKINRLRKSYEGKVKSLGLAGRNRAVKHEKEKKMLGLADLAEFPEEEWQNQKVMGRDVRKGLSSTSLAKLEKAMRMQPGPIPNNNEWEDLLGFEKAAPIQTVVEPIPKAQKEKHSIKANGLSNGAARLKTGKSSASASASASEAPRPKRSGKKRRYDEHSFEGYGEGFVDDDGGDTVMTGVAGVAGVAGGGGGGGLGTGAGGYSSGDGSRKSGASKKRRKEYGPSSSSGVNDRNGSYGVGMMGMASGIGAYGR